MLGHIDIEGWENKHDIEGLENKHDIEGLVKEIFC